MTRRAALNIFPQREVASSISHTNIARAATATTKQNGKVIGMQKVKGDKGKGRADNEDATEDEEEEYGIN